MGTKRKMMRNVDGRSFSGGDGWALTRLRRSFMLPTSFAVELRLCQVAVAMWE